MMPKAVMDRSKFPVADEYTPEQRRLINAELDEAEKGPWYGPFKNGREVAAFLNKWKRQNQPKMARRTR